MNNKYKVIILSSLVLLGSVSLPLVTKKAISDTERRPLAKLPKFNLDTLSNGSYSKNIETYFQDHFPFRDRFRKLNFDLELRLLNKLESKDYYKKGDYLGHLNWGINDSNLRQSASYFKNLNEEVFKGLESYYSLIPEKNDFLIEGQYPNQNVDAYHEVMKEFSNNIDLNKTLSLTNFYKTDLHWDQSSFVPLLENIPYKVESLGQFSGSYSDAMAVRNLNDTMNIITWEDLNEFEVKDLSSGKRLEFYNKQAFEDADPYNVFLGGPQPLVEIVNPSVSNPKTLYLVRDSYASSLAPYLTLDYERIVLIDSRYISKDILKKTIEPKAGDTVYYMMSLPVVANPGLFK